jgi:hypothetical protein
VALKANWGEPTEISRGVDECSNCRFFFRVKKLGEDRMVCRRFPPILMDLRAPAAVYFQPTTEKTDWCGEYDAIA